MAWPLCTSPMAFAEADILGTLGADVAALLGAVGPLEVVRSLVLSKLVWETLLVVWVLVLLEAQFSSALHRQ